MKKNKIFMLSLFAFVMTLMLVPNVKADDNNDAKGKEACATATVGEPCYYVMNGGKKVFFANGASIEITASEGGRTLITWNNGSQIVDIDTTVFGGMHNSETVVPNATITMTGGKLNGIFGGGLHKSTVTNVNIYFRGGEVSFIMGGGSAGFVTDDDRDDAHRTLNDAINKTTLTQVGSANIYIYGGTFAANTANANTSVFGGGEDYSYTGTSNVYISAGYKGEIDYVTGGGSNGYTKDTVMNIYGGKIDVLQAVNRGKMDSSDILVGGTAEITDLYASAEGTSEDAGVTGEATVSIEKGAAVTNVKPGQSGTQGVNKTGVKLTYNGDAVGTVAEGFAEEDIVKTIQIFIHYIDVDGESMRPLEIPENYKFTEEDLKELEGAKAAAKESGLNLKIYSDEELTKEFDVNTTFTDGTHIYISLSEIPEVTAPNTFDSASIYMMSALVSVIALAILAFIKKKSYNM